MNKKMIKSTFKRLKSRMKYFLFLGLIFNSLFAFSQVPLCQTASGFDLSSIISGIDPNLAREDGKYVVNLYFHLLSEDDGTNGSTEEEVITAMNLLDDYFDNPLYAYPSVYNDIIEFNLKCIDTFPTLNCLILLVVDKVNLLQIPH